LAILPRKSDHIYSNALRNRTIQPALWKKLTLTGQEKFTIAVF